MIINALRPILDFPLKEALKILSLGLQFLPTSVEVSDEFGTGELSAQESSGRITERIVVKLMVDEDSPRWPKFNPSLGVMVVNG